MMVAMIWGPYKMCFSRFVKIINLAFHSGLKSSKVQFESHRTVFASKAKINVFLKLFCVKRSVL